MRRTHWYGEVKDGRLKLDCPEVYREFVSHLKEGSRMEIVLQPEGKDVTVQQWKYLYSCVYKPFGDHFGWELDAVDDYMKSQYAQKRLIHLPKGITLTKTSFDRVGLSDFISFCRGRAAMEGVATQEPSEGWK